MSNTLACKANSSTLTAYGHAKYNETRMLAFRLGGSTVVLFDPGSGASIFSSTVW